MSGLNDSKKRDFISQLIVIMQQNGELLGGKGYDPASKINQLKEEMEIADQAEGHQREAMAEAKNATQQAQDSLNTAYTNASATVDLISGLLGKNDNLLLEIKKLRKTSSPAKKPNSQD